MFWGNSVVGESFNYGENCIVEDDVVIGNDVTLGHNVVLKSGTRLGNRVVMGDNTCTTGACWIGDDVAIRTGAIISKANIIEPGCFIGPGVITNHTKHVTHMRPRKHSEQLVTYISYGSIVGSQVSLLAGIYIAPGVTIGGGSVLVKSIMDSKKVFVGTPVASKTFDSSDILDIPPDAGTMMIGQVYLDHLKRYMPNLNTDPLFLLLRSNGLVS